MENKGKKMELTLTCNAPESRYFKIDSNFTDLSGEFDDRFVAVSGFSGPFDPRIFYAAPDMVEALKAAHAALNLWFPSQSAVSARHQVEEALRKAGVKL